MDYEWDIPGLVMTNSLLLKMIIELVDFPMNYIVIFQFAMLLNYKRAMSRAVSMDKSRGDDKDDDARCMSHMEVS